MKHVPNLAHRNIWCMHCVLFPVGMALAGSVIDGHAFQEFAVSRASMSGDNGADRVAVRSVGHDNNNGLRTCAH